MKTKLYTIILLILVAQVLEAQTEKRIALVIGNNNYPGKVLKNPVNDANLMSSTLLKLGFKVTKVINATKPVMEQAFMNFTEDVKNAKVTLIFLAGHGMQIDGINYFMPIDADPQSPEQVPWSAISINNLISSLNFYPQNLNIIILDACRNDPFRSWVRGDPEGFIRMEAKGTIIGYATCEGCTADDNPTGNNGLYTSKLVEELSKPQEIIDVFRNTRFDVLKASNERQSPIVTDQLTGRFFLKKPTIDNPEFRPGELVVNYGQINLITEISGDLYLDDKKLGYVNANSQNNLLQKIITGTHILKITGNESWSQSITVFKDSTINATAYRNKTTNITTSDNKAFNKIEVSKPSNPPNQITDIDGNTYKIVQIGDQIWMAENLKTTKYNDGTAIPLVIDKTAWLALTTPGYCWYKNEGANNKETYGALYNWYTVNTNKLCPIGWHVPTDKEWDILTTYLGGEVVAGGKLKEIGTTHWLSPNKDATNETGFTALPGGNRLGDGSYFNIGYSGTWFSSTDFFTNALYRFLSYGTSTLDSGSNDKQGGYSVRCLRDL